MTPLLTRLLAIILALAATYPSTSHAAEQTPQEVAQKFYDAYIRTKCDGAVVAKSKNATPAFKKAYAKFMDDGPDHDPIIQGQDYPDEGFKAGPAEISGKKATVVMRSRDSSFDHRIVVHLVNEGGTWLISATGDFPG